MKPAALSYCFLVYCFDLVEHHALLRKQLDIPRPPQSVPATRYVQCCLMVYVSDGEHTRRGRRCRIRYGRVCPMAPIEAN